MNEDRFWLLLSRYLAGEALPEEERELLGFIQQSKENKARFDAIVTYWGKNKQRSEAELEGTYGKVWSKINASQEGERHKSPDRIFKINAGRVTRLAAAAVVIFALGIYLFSTIHLKTSWVGSEMKTEKNAKGERSKILLADGSTVWLNADSELKFPDEFSAGVREVYLEGEAFFDVAKDPAKPFIIHLTDGSIRVLGTSFNVKAFSSDDFIETSVVTGRVAFIPESKTSNSSQDTVFISPDVKAVYVKNTKQVVQKKTKGVDDKGWVDGRLVFKSESFLEVAKALERTFGKRVVFDNEAIKNCQLTGTFQNNSLEEVLALLAETKDYTYSIGKSELHIDGSGCSEPEE